MFLHVEYGRVILFFSMCSMSSSILMRDSSSSSASFTRYLRVGQFDQLNRRLAHRSLHAIADPFPAHGDEALVLAELVAPDPFFLVPPAGAHPAREIAFFTCKF